VQSEQLLVARLLHSLHSDDPATHFQLLVTAKEQLVRGGPRRLRHTLPALGFAALAIVRRLGTAEGHGELGRALLRWLLGLALLLAELPEPLGALRLLLAGGLAASEEVVQELLAYEFFEQAFLLYEEQVAEQRARTTALQSIFSTLSAAYVFSSDNREALVQNAAGYASRLLRRSDQCKALCSCARLYWQPQSGVARASRDPTKVQGLLQRALRVAANAKQQLAAAGRTHAPASASQPSGNTVPGSSSAAAPATLFVEVLNHYLLYLELGMEGLDAAAVQAVLDQVQGELLAPAPAIDPETQRWVLLLRAMAPLLLLLLLLLLLRYWRSTVNHIHRMQAKGDAEVKARFAGLTCDVATCTKHLSHAFGFKASVARAGESVSDATSQMLHRAVSLRVPSIGLRRQPLRAMASQSRDPGYDLVIKQWPNKPGVPGDCPFCHRVLLTLAQKNIAYKTTLVDLTQKRPEWLLQASGGKVPVLRQESSGMVMPDSDVIVQHLEKEFPQPSMTSDIDPKIGSGLFPAFRAFLSAPKDAADTDKLQAALEGQLQEVEAALQAQKGPLFGGDTLNATDAALGPKLYHAQVALQHLKGYTLPDRFSALHKYLDYIKQQPAWQATDYGAAAIVAGWSAHH
ncbi:hypothetical protein QJQ45_026606, partial [Haematococcus lacustris]